MSLNLFLNRLRGTPLSGLAPMVRRALWSSTSVYWAYKRLRLGREGVWRRECDLWIDGFPRSANTFGLECLQASFPGSVILCHMHAPTPVIECVDRGVPGMLLLRSPVDAVTSYCIMSGHAILSSLVLYRDYHRCLMGYRDRLFIVRFEDITSRPNAVIAQFAERFALETAPVSEDLRAVALRRVEKNWAPRHPSGEINELKVARPSAERRERAEELRKEIRSAGRYRAIVGQCERLYADLLEDATPAARP